MTNTTHRKAIGDLNQPRNRRGFQDGASAESVARNALNVSEDTGKKIVRTVRTTSFATVAVSGVKIGFRKGKSKRA